MLFQTHYRIDPYEQFEPPLIDCDPIRITDSIRQSELLIQLRRATHEEDPNPTAIHVFLNRHVESVPDVVARALQGKVSSVGRKSQNTSPDGFQDFPYSYRDFIKQLAADMDGQSTEIFNLLRWRHGINGGPLALTSDARSMRWQSDAHDKGPGQFAPFLNESVQVGIIEIEMPECQEIHLSHADRMDVEMLLGSDSLQPLHHDLLREAWQNQRINPRSSLVLCMAALETAVKSTLCELNESLRWLMENLSSPPIDKILRDYLPESPARNTIRGEVLRPPAPLLTSIRRGLEQRNRLVHGREESPSHSELLAILLAVRDTAYLLDFYRGHDWALQHLRTATRDSLMQDRAGS